MATRFYLLTVNTTVPRVVITGCPGAGKTTLIAELAARGYATVEESARAIIAERLEQWYRSCGYILHEVPRLPVPQRADYILRVLAESPRITD